MLHYLWKRVSREVILFLAFFMPPERKRTTRAAAARAGGVQEAEARRRGDRLVRQERADLGSSAALALLPAPLRAEALGFIGFDNLHRKDARIPRVFFTHDNYLRDFTGNRDSKRDFYDKKVVLLVRQPERRGGLAVSPVEVPDAARTRRG